MNDIMVLVKVAIVIIIEKLEEDITKYSKRRSRPQLTSERFCVTA